MGQEVKWTKELIAAKMAETIDPIKLAEEKMNAYKRYCVAIFNAIIEAVEDVDLEQIEELTFSSPAGDEMGLDNRVIDFGYGDECADIYQAVSKLRILEEIVDGIRDPSEFDPGRW